MFKLKYKKHVFGLRPPLDVFLVIEKVFQKFGQLSSLKVSF